MNLNKLQKILIEKKHEKKLVKLDLNAYQKKRKKLLKEHKKIQEALITIQRASKLTQDRISQHISGIVTKALATVFDDPYTFHINFVERRNTTEADLILIKDDYEYSILESAGYGVADVCSFALRVAYIILSGKRKLLIFDEPFRHLDEDRQTYAAQLVHYLSEELGIMFIIATHSKTFNEECNNIFKVTQTKGNSKIRRIK